jgi:putative transcription factor
VVVLICDLCGKTGIMYKVEIEGSRVVACETCAKFGKVLFEVKEQTPSVKSGKKESVQTKTSHQIAKAPETLQLIVKDYSTRIKNAREKQKIKQEDFAKMISEKESVILHLESGKMQPNLQLASKLEKVLGIKLIEEITLEPEEKKEGLKPNSGPMTLGDLINIKKR